MKSNQDHPIREGYRRLTTRKKKHLTLHLCMKSDKGSFLHLLTAPEQQRLMNHLPRTKEQIIEVLRGFNLLRTPQHQLGGKSLFVFNYISNIGNRLQCELVWRLRKFFITKKNHVERSSVRRDNALKWTVKSNLGDDFTFEKQNKTEERSRKKRCHLFTTEISGGFTKDKQWRCYVLLLGQIATTHLLIVIRRPLLQPFCLILCDLLCRRNKGFHEKVNWCRDFSPLILISCLRVGLDIRGFREYCKYF